MTWGYSGLRWPGSRGGLQAGVPAAERLERGPTVSRLSAPGLRVSTHQPSSQRLMQHLRCDAQHVGGWQVR
jgi:hypothetical protein